MIAIHFLMMVMLWDYTTEQTDTGHLVENEARIVCLGSRFF